MNKHFTTRITIISIILFLISMILIVPVVSEEQWKIVRKGLYYLQKSSAPEYFITGVSVPELVKAHFEGMNKVDERLVGKWGRSLTLFRKKDKKQVKITVAVYENVAEAEDSVLELLNTVSTIFKSGSKSGGVIGTHSWYLASPEGRGTLIFTYNNSLFQLFSTDYRFAEKIARSIVVDLTHGTNGIRLGKQVFPPKVMDVRFPEKLKVRKEAPLIFEGQDPSHQQLSFVVSSSKGQLFETKKIGEKVYLPTEAGADELRIYVINEMNVVSPLYIKKLEIEK